MKKVFGQTVRDLKREVNKKVLKVPGIEQKILDATSNEPWGPRGADMAELAQASRNYHEYQLIMAVLWKRINDTGKNWRHVYKALTVLEYLVAHGSERVIDEIREHAYHISILADFQYIDSNGKDQGSNIRRKSQGLVGLVNSKERIQEIRLKAQSNKDKYNGVPSSVGAYRNSSRTGAGSYGDRFDNEHNGNRDDERSRHGRDRELGYRDDDRYGKGRDSFSKDGDRHRDYRTRSRSQSVDGYTDRSFDDDDDRYSSRSADGKADDQSQDGRQLDRTLSEHSVDAPPSYEEATRDVQSSTQDERDGENVAAPTELSSSPVSKPNSPSKSTGEGPDNSMASDTMASPNNGFDAFDEFDPRGPVSAAPPAASSPELDIFGLSALECANSMPTDSITTTFEANLPTDSGFGTNFSTLSSATTSTDQATEDPFGDAPFKAIPDDNFPSQQQSFQPVTSFQPSGSLYGCDTSSSAAPNVDSFPSFDFENALGSLTYAPVDVNGQNSSGSPPFSASELPAEQSRDDILDSILPRTGFSSQESQTAAQTNVQTAQMNFVPHPGLSAQAGSQGFPTNSHILQANPFHYSGFSAPVAEQELSINSETAQINPFQTSGQSVTVGSQGSPTKSQNLFPPSTASQGSPRSTQAPQARSTQAPQGNFLQSLGHSISPTSQGSVTNMPTSQMNLLQPSGSSDPQGPQTNMQPAEMNFFQPLGLSGSGCSAVSQKSQENTQPAQMNFFQPSGISESSALPGPESQRSPLTTNMSFFQSSGQSAPASSTIPTNMEHHSSGLFAPVSTAPTTSLQTTQSVAPTNMQSAQLNLGSQSMLSDPPASQETQFSAPRTMQRAHLNSGSHSMLSDPLASKTAPVTQANYMQVTGHPANMQPTYGNLGSQSMLSDSLASQTAHAAAPSNTQATQFGAQANMHTAHGNLGSQSMLSDPFASQAAPATAGPLANSHSNEKFLPKSTVWADTLSRGLVNFNISGPKTNPLDDIGIDFAAINRKEKRLEAKSSAAAPVSSTITMGKAMGSGSGLGRATAGGLAPPPNPMMGGMGMIGMGMSMGGGGGMGMGGGGGMGMGMGMGMGAGMNMGGYGGNMSQPPMGMNMGMNMSMGQGVPGRPPNGMLPQGPGMPGNGYNAMMGMGGYGMQQPGPYGGGYR